MRRNLLTAAVLFLLLVAAAGASAATTPHAVASIGLTVGDLDRAITFFTRVLPFQTVTATHLPRGAADDWLALRGTQVQTAELRLGDERLTLTEHRAHPGRPIPADSRSCDHWFQHIAIVVSDMDAAYAHLQRARVQHVSTAPQTLPEWNRDAGGIRAFYFRDPEDHVLEIIWFPPGKGDPRWQRRTTNVFLGIDHTAIVVKDTERSLSFYRDALGMNVVGGAENFGPEQEHLNQVFGARLRITALRAARGPGVEFLEYIAPPGGRPLPADAQANDRVFWTTQLLVDDPASTAQALQGAGGRMVSRPGRRAPATSRIVRDPDGHALDLRGGEPGTIGSSGKILRSDRSDANDQSDLNGVSKTTRAGGANGS